MGLREERGAGGSIDATAPPTTDGAAVLPQVSAGAHHACALTREGAVYCWGNDRTGALGVPPSSLNCGELGHAPYSNGDVEHTGPANPTPHAIEGFVLP